MCEYTKGPWNIEKDDDVITSIGPLVPVEYAGYSWLGVSDADANLISAAPEMLETLEKNLKFFEFAWRDIQMNDYSADLLEEVTIATRDIIAKARGE